MLRVPCMQRGRPDAVVVLLVRAPRTALRLS